MSNITFYYADGACSLASHIVLEEVGVDYTPVRVDLSRRENFTEEYLAINPRGKVPALIDGGRRLVENLAISSYVIGRYGSDDLHPPDDWAAAQTLEMSAWFSGTVHQHFTHFRRPDRFSDEAGCEAGISVAGRSRFMEALKELATILEGRSWMVGGRYGLCDAYALVFFDWSARQKLPFDYGRGVQAWLAAMLMRPAVRNALTRERSPLIE